MKLQKSGQIITSFGGVYFTDAAFGQTELIKLIDIESSTFYYFNINRKMNERI